MKYTLLELTQNVLSSMDSDEVSSISDTVESLQVVKCIRSAYDDLLARTDLSVNKQLFNLTSSGSSSFPVLMYKPDYVEQIFWIKYNKIQEDDTDPAWGEVNFMPQASFVDYVQSLVPSETNVDTMTYTTSEGAVLVINHFNDRSPSYYTSFDDNTIIFDGFDSEVDSTLQANKTICYGNRATTFVEADSFVPELQPAQFNLLLNEAKALAWAELRQMPHQKAERTARRNWVHLGKSRNNVPTGAFRSGAHSFDKLPDFGRK